MAGHATFCTDDEGPVASAAEADTSADLSVGAVVDNAALADTSTPTSLSCPFCYDYRRAIVVNGVDEFLRHCLRECRRGPQLSPLCPVSMSLLQSLRPVDSPRITAVTTALHRLAADPALCPLCREALVVQQPMGFHVLSKCLNGPRLPPDVYGGAFDCIEDAAVKYLGNTDVMGDATAPSAGGERVVRSTLADGEPLQLSTVNRTNGDASVNGEQAGSTNAKTAAPSNAGEHRDTVSSPSVLIPIVVHKLLAAMVRKLVQARRARDARVAAIATSWVWEQDGSATPPENFHGCPLCGKWLLNREQMVFHAIRRCVLGPANLDQLPSEQLLVDYITHLLEQPSSALLATEATLVSNMTDVFKNRHTAAWTSGTFDCPRCTAKNDDGHCFSLSQIDAHVSQHGDLTWNQAELNAGSSQYMTVLPADFDMMVCPLCRCEPCAREAADFVPTNRWVERHVWYDCPLGPRLKLDFLPSPCSSQRLPSKDAMKAMLRGIVRYDAMTIGLADAFEKPVARQKEAVDRVVATSRRRGEALACPFCRRVVPFPDNMYDHVSECGKAQRYSGQYDWYLRDRPDLLKVLHARWLWNESDACATFDILTRGRACVRVDDAVTSFRNSGSRLAVATRWMSTSLQCSGCRQKGDRSSMVQHGSFCNTSSHRAGWARGHWAFVFCVSV